MRRHQRMNDRQTRKRGQHQPQLGGVAILPRGQRRRRRSDDRQQQDQPGFEKERQADDDRGEQTGPGRAASAREAQGRPGEAARPVGQLQHGAKAQAQRDDEASAAQDGARPLLDGLGRFLHRQSRQQADGEGAAQQADKGMKPALDDEGDGKGDADDRGRDQAIVGRSHRRDPAGPVLVPDRRIDTAILSPFSVLRTSPDRLGWPSNLLDRLSRHFRNIQPKHAMTEIFCLNLSD